MKTFISTLDITIYVSAHGHNVRFAPGEKKAIPDSLVDEALTCGLSPEDGDGDGKVGQTDDADRVQKLVDAMWQIMAEGKKAHVTRSGEPRHKVLEDIVGFKFTTAEREAAWDICSLKDAES